MSDGTKTMSSSGELLYGLWREQVLAHGGSEPGAWYDLYESEKKAWEKIAEPVPSRGESINKAAELSSLLRQLRERLEEMKKTAKRTPPKTLKKEWDKVQMAKEMVPQIESFISISEKKLMELIPLAGWDEGLGRPGLRTSAPELLGALE